MPSVPASQFDGLPLEEVSRRVAKARELILDEVHKRIIGQTDVLEQMLIGLFSQGHCLAIGVPGLAKALAVSTLARTLGLRYQRVPLTPDMTPTDLAGEERLEDEPSSGRRVPRFWPGPLFTQMLLADDFNHAAPKTQAMLLQAMQESQATVAGKPHPLEPPFFVLATQNPADPQAAFPLHEATLDRFALSILLGYPSRDEERRIVETSSAPVGDEVRVILRARDICQIQRIAHQLPASRSVVDYAVDLVRATRPTEPDSPEFIRRWLAWGAGPRATQCLLACAKARALLKGRHAVHAADIRWVAKPVLRHRLALNPTAIAQRVALEPLLDQLLHSVRESRSDSPLPAMPILEMVDTPQTNETALAAPELPPSARSFPPDPSHAASAAHAWPPSRPSS